MKRDLKKYIAPAAAFTSLFMLACSEDDAIVDPSNDMMDTDTLDTVDTDTVDTVDTDTISNAASLVGNWNLEKKTDSDGEEDVYGVEICPDNGEYCYTYEIVWSFEGDGDFTQTSSESYTEDGEDYFYEYVYEGSWEFLSEDSLRVLVTVDENLNYDILDFKINSITNEELLLSTSIDDCGELYCDYAELDVDYIFTKIDE